MRVLTTAQALRMGFSADRRRRKRQHRRAARALMQGGTLLNPRAGRGTIPGDVARWHLEQARYL